MDVRVGRPRPLRSLWTASEGESDTAWNPTPHTAPFGWWIPRVRSCLAVQARPLLRRVLPVALHVHVPPPPLSGRDARPLRRPPPPPAAELRRRLPHVAWRRPAVEPSGVCVPDKMLPKKNLRIRALWCPAALGAWIAAAPLWSCAGVVPSAGPYPKEGVKLVKTIPVAHFGCHDAFTKKIFPPPRFAPRRARSRSASGTALAPRQCWCAISSSASPSSPRATTGAPRTTTSSFVSRGSRPHRR